MSRARTAAGFSLIELLVALVIIVLLAGGVSLSLGLAGRDDTGLLQQQASLLFAQLETAQQEAVLANTPIGLRLEPQDGAAGLRLQWLRFQQPSWTPAGEILPVSNLPAQLRLALAIDGAAAPLARPGDDGLPQLLLQPDGFLPDFALSLDLAGGGSTRRIGTDARGQLRSWSEDLP